MHTADFQENSNIDVLFEVYIPVYEVFLLIKPLLNVHYKHHQFKVFAVVWLYFL